MPPFLPEQIKIDSDPSLPEALFLYHCVIRHPWILGCVYLACLSRHFIMNAGPPPPLHSIDVSRVQLNSTPPDISPSVRFVIPGDASVSRRGRNHFFRTSAKINHFFVRICSAFGVENDRWYICCSIGKQNRTIHTF